MMPFEKLAFASLNTDWPAPEIPGLVDGNTVDLDELGIGNLKTFIKYTDIAPGDAIYPNWRSCSAQGDIYDMADSRINVTVGGGYTEEMGMPVEIPNALVVAVDQGRVFYSYSVWLRGNSDNAGPESSRRFVYVGQRPSAIGALPVVQIMESHDLHLDPRALGPIVKALIAPYRAMREGDTVRFRFEGYDDWGNLDEVWQSQKIVGVNDIDRPLTVDIPRSQFDFIEGGHALLSYTVEYTDTLITGSSLVQAVQISAPTTPLQPVIRLGNPENPESPIGDTLDPTQLPAGITLQVPPYAGARIGDCVLLYWLTSNLDSRVCQALLLDQSNIESGVLLFRLPAQVLKNSIGEEVRVFYQYAQEGMAQTSQVLSLMVREPLDLIAPSVEGATSEAMPGDNKAYLAATSTKLNGAFVILPPSLVIGAGDQVEVHWEGHPEGGRYIATHPYGAENPRRFQIPSTAIAANMEESDSSEAKRFAVFYRFTPAGGVPDDSGSLQLRILPLLQDEYTSVQFHEGYLVGNTLSLTSVPETGVDLRLDKWVFIAAGLMVTIRASGLNGSNSPIFVDVRNPGRPVTAQEAISGIANEKLPKNFLRQLKLNSPITLTATVSFDGGGAFVSFPRVDNIMLIA